MSFEGEKAARALSVAASSEAGYFVDRAGGADFAYRIGNQQMYARLE
jgi:hypothetical protein